MRNSKIVRRLFGAAIAAFTVAGTAMLTAGAAQAAPPPGTLGTLTLTPATGSDLTAPQVRTSAGCNAGSDAYNVLVTGPGAFAPGFLITTTSSAGYSQTSPFTIFFGLNMHDAAVDLGTTIVAGEYDVTARCVDSFLGTVTGTFTTAMYFTSPTAYQTTDPNQPITTTTALAVSPPSPVTAGVPVTLTATVTPATAAGTVQFRAGTTNVGSPVTVSGGTAVLTTSALPVGVLSLTAAFTGASPNIGNSTSPPVSYTVQAPVATPTTTALSVNPSGSVAQFTLVTLSATVSPAAATGTVQFLDGTSPLGAPVTVTAGSAAFATSSLTVGAHTLAASFVPANPAAYVPSQSPGVPLTVTPFTGVTASEDITTTVLAGSLVISVDNRNVTLPSPTLNPAGSLLSTSGSLNPVTVTDTRAGNVGWNVSGQTTDFSDGATHAINGANLGWSPQVIDFGASQTVTAGPVVAPGNGLAPGQPAPPGVGLASSRTLATAASGAGIGTAHLSAGLALNVPTSTVAGTYTATLTLTAI